MSCSPPQRLLQGGCQLVADRGRAQSALHRRSRGGIEGRCTSSNSIFLLNIVLKYQHNSRVLKGTMQLQLLPDTPQADALRAIVERFDEQATWLAGA